MSLILDALRRLERDKQPRDPGVVVVGQVPWGGRDPGRRALPAVLLGAAVVALAVGAFWALRPRPVPGAAPPPGGPASPAGTSSLSSSASPAVVPDTSAEPGAPGGTPSVGPTSGDMSDPATPTPPPPRRGFDLPAPEEAALASPRVPRENEDALDVLEAPAGSPAPTGPAEPTPPATAAPGERPLRLTAISERDGHPVALLNDRLVREGDSFDGVRVLRIHATEVEVEVDGERRIVGF